MWLKIICERGSVQCIHITKLNLTRSLHNTHYDILNLPKNCSNKEIRDSYLKLSKEYHPDKNKDKESHRKFVEISEAYNILSKPLSRREYDFAISNPWHNRGHVKYAYARNSNWGDETIWEFRDKSKDQNYEEKPYYGIKGVKRIPNTMVVILCLTLCAVGVGLQFLAIRKSLTFERGRLEKQSAELVKLHAEIRAQALQNSNEKQIELLKERLNNNHSRTNS